jgi:actin
MTEESSVSLILDTGSWMCKAGLSTEDFPRVSMPTLVSSYKTINKEDQTVLYFGKEAIEKQNTLGLQSILNEGRVEDWELMESFWQHLISAHFAQNMTERPVLTSFHPHSSKFAKEKATQVFFEVFNVPLYFTASNSLLVLYSSGRVHGMALDCGHGVTSAVPISDGAPLYHSQSTMNHGGKAITDFLARTTNLGNELARDIKEKYCRVSLDYDREVNDMRGTTGANLITLPDGSAFDLKTNNIRAAEGLFQPDLIDGTHTGIHDLVLDSLNKTEPEFRNELLGNIIVAGGNANFPNFNERLQRELLMREPSSVKVKCLNFTDKVNSAWFGGAIVSSLGSFQPMWVTRAEYDECGPAIINRKCI